MTKTGKYLTLMLCAGLVLGMTAGCKRKAPPLNTAFSGGAGSDTGFGSGGGGASDGELPWTDPNTQWESGEKYGLQTVYFDYDSSTLNTDAMAVLRENAAKIKQVPGKMVQVAGHCDDRGTQEYNLALGERRALAVRTYLIQTGVPGERLLTISYGKEAPAVPGSGEAAWAKNRRAEFSVAR